MKYTRQYSSTTAYNNDTTRIVPNLSLIKEGTGDLKYNPPFIEGNVASAGTIVLVNNANQDNHVFVPYQSWDSSTYSAYTPIGIVAVPATHTPDGTVRIVSLKNMSLNNPDNGSTELNGSFSTISFYWGGVGSEVTGLNNYDRVPNIDPATQQQSTIGSMDWVRLPTNYTQCTNFSGGTPSLLDVGTKYYSGTVTGWFGISPYSRYGWESYEALEVISKATNALTDMDGRGNTDSILAADNAVSTDWQTASTITNNSGSTNSHAPAQCCWRYGTLGVPSHGWYLPSCGELAYFIVRYGDINEALTKIMLSNSNLAVRMWRSDPTYADSSSDTYGNWLWSSTEYSAINARYVYVSNGDVGYFSKDDSFTDNRVRAFAALAV